MTRLSIWILAVLVSVGASTVLARTNVRPAHRAYYQLDGDGAFRDGLYIGRLAAQSNRPFRPPVGRWSTKNDRASFLAGYRKGYGASEPATPASSFRI